MKSDLIRDETTGQPMGWDWSSPATKLLLSARLNEAPAFGEHSGGNKTAKIRITSFVGQYWNNVDAVIDVLNADVRWKSAKITLLTQISQWYPVCGVYQIFFCNRQNMMGFLNPQAETEKLFREEMRRSLGGKLKAFCGDGKAAELGCTIGSNTYDPEQTAAAKPLVDIGREEMVGADRSCKADRSWKADRTVGGADRSWKAFVSVLLEEQIVHGRQFENLRRSTHSYVWRNRSWSRVLVSLDIEITCSTNLNLHSCATPAVH